MNNLILKYRENKFDYVFDSQKVFEKIMFSLSFPGRIFKLPEIKLAIETAETNYLLLCAMTLLDIETNFNVNCDNEETLNTLKNYIEINTGASFENIGNADFIFALNELKNDYKKIKKGTFSNPHKSSTIFYSVEEISDNLSYNAACIGLTGPGIEKKNIIYINNIQIEEINFWIENSNDYPLGVDMFLVSRDGKICGIPRSSSVCLKGAK